MKYKKLLIILFAAFYFLLSTFVLAQTNGPDLIPTDLWWSPAPVYSGNFLNVGFRIKNTGSQSAGPVHILLTKDNAVLCGFDAPALNPNQTFERGPNLLGLGYSNLCSVASSEPPGYQIKLLVDDTNLTSEINENNNATTTFITIIGENKKEKKPSFSLPSVSDLPSSFGGQQVSVGLQIQTTEGVSQPQPVPSALSQQISPPSFEEPSFRETLNRDFLKGIVPCGTSYTGYRMCTICDFYKLIQNIINFILFVSAPLATLVAIYVAFLFFFSFGSQETIKKAKSNLNLLLWGIAWILGSWLVLNTIINVVANPSVFPKPWNQIQCSVTTSGATSGATPEPGNNTNLSDIVKPAGIERLDFGSYQDGVDTSTEGYQNLNTETTGLGQVDPAPPFSPTQIAGPMTNLAADQSDTGGVDKNLVKAIIQAESSGNPNAIHIDRDGKASYGLMQVRPDTARRYDSSLVGLPDSEVGEKLKNPSYNIQIGTAYLKDLSDKYSGNLDKTIAAYNGGPGANGTSVNCFNSLRWQCGWDNNAHTVPNKGYAVTRNYVVKVNNYYSQLSK